jgi:hypothetical protein
VQIPSLFRLAHGPLGSDGLLPLVRQPSLPALRHLELIGNSLGTAGVRLLATAPWLGQLESLVLNKNAFGLPAIRDLLRAPLQSLSTLSLEECLLYPNEIAVLGEARNLPSLRTLRLGGNHHLSDCGVEVLAGCSLLARLSWLDLSWMRLSDTGVIHLASSPRVASLRFLMLWNNVISDPGAIALAESPHLRQLELLDLRMNHLLTTTGKLALREAFGERVVW